MNKYIIISHIKHLFCIYPSRYSCTTLFPLYLLTVPVNASRHVSLTFKETPTLHSVKIILSVPIIFFRFHLSQRCCVLKCICLSTILPFLQCKAPTCCFSFKVCGLSSSRSKSNIQHVPGELLITLVGTLIINPLPYFCLPQNGYLCDP